MQAFGIDAATTTAAIAQTNLDYGADKYARSNVLFVNGRIDPWHAASVLNDLPSGAKAIMVEGASHHFWTHPPQPTDSAQITAVRGQIADAVTEWLSQ